MKVSGKDNNDVSRFKGVVCLGVQAYAALWMANVIL
jgi:hypothetical protein